MFFWNTVYFWLGKTTARHTGILLPILSFDHITVLGMSLCIRLPNLVQICPSSAEICHIDFQDGHRCGAISLPVSDRVTLLFSDVSFYQQTKFRSSIHGWDVTIRFEKIDARNIGILLPVLLPYHRSRHVILHQSAKFHPNRTAEKNDVMSIFKMADVR